MTEWVNLIAPVPRIIGHSWMDPDWVEPRRVIYDHELMLFGDGEGIVEIEGEAFRCTPGTYLVIPPAQWESSRNGTAHPWLRHWIHFDWTYQPGQECLPINTFYPQRPQVECYHLPPPGIPNRILQGRMRAPQRIFDLYTRLEQRWQGGAPHGRLTCRGLLLELLLELLDDRAESSGESYRGDVLMQEIKLALDDLSLQPMEAMPSIQEFLGQFDYSYAHLARLFHHAFGMPPLAYVNVLRIGRAKLLLRDTHRSVSEIAHQVGIDDPGYFSRLFKKYVGRSPSAYAQAKRAQSAR